MTPSTPLAAALLCLAPALAHAKVAAPEGGVLTVVRPYQGEQGVPLNTRIWLDELSATDYLNYAPPREPRLFDPDGAPILLGTPITITAPGGNLLVYTPPAPLLPDTTYELRNCGADECGHLLATFVTATTTDADPPAIPEVTDVHFESDRLQLDVDFADDILVLGPDEDPLDEPLVSRSIIGAATQQHPLDVRRFDFIGDDLRFATYDLAGNFSGWSDVTAIASDQGCVPDRDPGRTAPHRRYSCRTSAPSPWYLLIPLLLRRRRP